MRIEKDSMPKWLALEILVDRAEGWLLIENIAKSVFNAQEIWYREDNLSLINIDAGMNDTYAECSDNAIKFVIRYGAQQEQYEQRILNYARKNGLTVKFIKSN